MMAAFLVAVIALVRDRAELALATAGAAGPRNPMGGGQGTAARPSVSSM